MNEPLRSPVVGPPEVCRILTDLVRLFGLGCVMAGLMGLTTVLNGQEVPLAWFAMAFGYAGTVALGFPALTLFHVVRLRQVLFA